MPLSVDGKMYDTPIGKERLFPIAKLSQKLTDAGYPRDVQTVRKWEVKGVIPPAIFRHGGKRLFSEEQIDTIVAVVVKYDLRQGAPITGDFIADVWEAVDVVNNKYLGGKKNANK